MLGVELGRGVTVQILLSLCTSELIGRVQAAHFESTTILTHDAA